jgi:hypothetical protein
MTYLATPRARQLTVLVAVACLATGAVWFGSRTAADGLTGDTVTPQPTSMHVAPDTAPRAGVVLPDGTDTVGGYPVGFPYTDLGAVAAQAALTRAQVGFDYAQAADIAAVYAAPADRAVFTDRARAAVAQRRDLVGAPTYGPVPSPASYAATPIAYTLDELGTDYYAVHLLSAVTLTGADSTVRIVYYAGTQTVAWVDGDWKLVQASNEDLQHLAAGQPPAAVPGTAKFDRAGWIRISVGSWS